MRQCARGQSSIARLDCWAFFLAAAFIASATGGCFSSGGSRGAGSPVGNGRAVLAVPSGVDIALKLDYLSRRNHPSRMGRAPLEAAYKELIRQHRGDPRVAEAMIRIGHLYHAIEIPELNIHPDTEKAMEWFRMAAQTATKGSPTWLDAQFMVAQCHLTSPEEARNRLRSISDRASLVLAKVEYALQSIAIEEGNLNQAEHHCRRLLSWYNDRSRIPKESLVKHEVDCLMIASGNVMVHQIRATHDSPVAQRRARIRQLMNDFAGKQALHRDGSEQLKALGPE